MIETIAVKQEHNKSLLQKRFSCACKTYDTHAVVQKKMADITVDLARKYVSKHQKQMMEIGCGTGLLTGRIMQEFQCSHYWANDLVGDVEGVISAKIKEDTSFLFQQGDAEKIEFPLAQDVIWSGATIQWIKNLDIFFARLAASLKQNAYAALSSFDVYNFKEVKAITGKGIDYKGMDEVLDVASSYFNVLDKKNWQQVLYFDSPKNVLKHMRFTGVNAVSPTKWGKADLEQFNHSYELFKMPEGYPLTYHPFVLILQKK